ncbi:hypothetical protein AAVH_01483 [Aphelenchoides avenae]|nr:hypothetical protein AAVH_01483 [Aphelenchus avenae]
MSGKGPSVSWYESPYYLSQSTRVALRERESASLQGTSRVTEAAPSPEHCSLFKRKFAQNASDPNSEANDDDDALPPPAAASSEPLVTPVLRVGLSRNKTTPRSIGFDSGRQAAELLRTIPDEDLEEIDENFCDGDPAMPLSIRRSSLVLCEKGKEVPKDRPYVPVKITGHPIRCGSPTGRDTRKRPFGFTSPLLMGPPCSSSTPKAIRSGHNQSTLAMKTVVNEAFAAAKKPKFDDSLDDAETDFLLSQVCAAPAPVTKPTQPPQQYAVVNKPSSREAAPQATTGSLPDTPKGTEPEPSSMSCEQNPIATCPALQSACECVPGRALRTVNVERSFELDRTVSIGWLFRQKR